MPKIEKDLLKVKGSDGQWHYIPAVGGGDTPTWEAVQNKPFSTLGGGLEVDENGVLSAQGGGGGSANAVQYVAQSLTDEQKAQARENIGAKAATEKSAYIISKTRSYGYIHTDGMNFDGVYAQIQSGKVVMLLVDNNATYYGVITPTDVADKTIMFYNIRDISQSDVGGCNKGIVYFGFTWRKGDDSLTEWWGDIPRVKVDETLTESGSAADAKAVSDALTTKLDKNQGTGNAGKILGVGEDGIVVPQDKPSGGTVTVDNALSSTSVNPVQNKVVTAALAEKITAPTTAAVGQIIKVKSVDTTGKPTEWEAVDLPSGGEIELVSDVTTTEEVNMITYSPPAGYWATDYVIDVTTPVFANGSANATYYIRPFNAMQGMVCKNALRPTAQFAVSAYLISKKIGTDYTYMVGVSKGSDIFPLALPYGRHTRTIQVYTASDTVLFPIGTSVKIYARLATEAEKNANLQ